MKDSMRSQICDLFSEHMHMGVCIYSKEQELNGFNVSHFQDAKTVLCV